MLARRGFSPEEIDRQIRDDMRQDDIGNPLPISSGGADIDMIASGRAFLRGNDDRNRGFEIVFFWIGIVGDEENAAREFVRDRLDNAADIIGSFREPIEYD